MGVSLLVVDDSPLARRTVLKALPDGWATTIRQVCNGREALSAIQQERPDVMFLDLTMPEMDGYAVLEALRNDTNPPAVVVLSADIQPVAQQRIFSLGARAFIKKPVSAEALGAVLDQEGLR